MQPGWDSRNAANFWDQLIEWERRIEEYEGESLETFSDGMKIAVLASHALLDQLVECIEWCDRTCRSFFNLAESLTRMVEEWSRKQPVQVQRRWMLMQSVGARERDASCADVPATQRKTANLTKPRARPRARANRRTPPDKNTPAKFEGECRHCGKKGHKWADCRKRLTEVKDKKVHVVGETPSTATVAAVEETVVIDETRISGDCSDDENNSDDGNEAWVLSVEGNDKPAHTCPWNFAEGGRDLGPSNVQTLNCFRQESDGVV